MGHLAPGKIFENMLQLKCFGLHYERILDSKWLYYHIEIMISATEICLGFGGILRENFEMFGTIWSVLMYYFDQI